MAVNTTPVFAGLAVGQLTAFPAASSTTEADLLAVNAADDTRIDSITVALDDTAVKLLNLYLHDGTNDDQVANIATTRAVKNAVTNGSITFAWAATTITRSAGSWLADGYKVGDTPIVTGAPDAANNLDGSKAITTLTDTVLTISTATMTVRSACYGVATVVLADVLGVTNILAHANMAGLVQADAAGNKFLIIPKGWKLRGKFNAALTTAKTAWVQVRGWKFGDA